MPGIVCGLAFSLGLWLVMCADGELFTGNCLLLSEYKPWMSNQYAELAGISITNKKIARCVNLSRLKRSSFSKLKTL
jgi:formate/nitrite transporter FocA (FNT family)